jgi:methylated-DNA-[protein]-cysteine S-methyltransferase
MPTYYTFSDTPAGTLLLIGDGTTLTGLHWEVFKRRPAVGPTWTEDAAAFSTVLQQLSEYFAGSRQAFDFPYQMKGTDFQMSVWKELEKIPYGERSSYQAIATAIGKPKATRAVGTAVGSNPMSIVVPCHRVLTSSGALGGFAGGLPSKVMLLAREETAPLASLSLQ